MATFRASASMTGPRQLLQLSVRQCPSVGQESIPPRPGEALELTYATRVTERLQVQPKLQYVINPGWDRDRPNALVIGVRLSFDLTLQ